MRCPRNHAALSAVMMIALAAVPATSAASAAELWIGAAASDITPDGPIALTGQRNLRIAREIDSRCTVNVLALESRQGDTVIDQAVLVSCDLCVIRHGIQAGVRRHLADRLPDLDLDKLFLAATHTHSAPVLLQDRYQGYGDAIQPDDYVKLLNERLADAITRAWRSRAPGAVGRGLGQAVVGCNRRAVFSDGSAVMYGKTDSPHFRNIEGYEDHSVDVLFFCDLKKNLKAVAVTLACPSQSVSGNIVSADFWHPVRRLLRERHGEDLHVLGFCAPAGDQSPRLMFRKKSEARMVKLRGLTRTEELGRRIAEAVDDVLEVAGEDLHTDVPLVHRIERFDVPGRKVTDAEYELSKKLYDELAAKEKLVGPDYWNMNFYKLTVSRYQAQQVADPLYPMEMHVLRLGDVAVATNPFELFVDYGAQIESRSAAGQTVLIQLASPVENAYYVPTPKAVAGGGYSAIVEQSLVGPEGGQALVEATVRSINELWEK